MRFARLLVAALLGFGLVTLPSQAQSQQNESQHGTTVGLGLSLTQGFASSETNTVSSSPLSIAVPITFSAVRIEPEVGYVRSTQSSDVLESTHSTLLLGAGTFYLSRMDDVQLHIGARFGLRRTAIDMKQDLPIQSAEWQNVPAPENLDVSSNRTTFNYSIGPAVGGEYYISDHLSLGVEARVLYTNRDTNNAPSVQILTLPAGAPTSSGPSGALINTEAAGYLRVHF